jgi:nucleoside-diphosphate-sugar epimerase
MPATLNQALQIEMRICSAMYIIVGAPGFMGRVVTQKLLAAGGGAEPCIIDSVLDQSAMIKAFGGAKVA